MDYFYSQLLKNELNKDFIEFLEVYSEQTNQQIYLLNSPLIDKKYNYNINDVGIVLMREHKITFVSFSEKNEDAFRNYIEDVIEDISSISDTYNYKDLIGRARSWKESLTCDFFVSKIDDFKKWIESDIKVTDSSQYRRLSLIITLFIGSINDVSGLKLEEAQSKIMRVKQKIQLFDSDQTRFIYGDIENDAEKLISVQGLSGTGKTELLMHKLRDIYLSEPELPIGFTCFNIILADNLRKRIPVFFNQMMVKKQIDWEKLLCVNSWGRFNDPRSGIYRYICHHYSIIFNNYRQTRSFKKVCEEAIEQLKDKDCANNPAFSYIFIDESQDFDKSFFDLCKMVTKNKVFVAGDVFQNIFVPANLNEIRPTLLLRNCYRTDPKTLMIAHSLGMGLYEEKKISWLEDELWKQSGYKVNKNGRNYTLERYPLRRFENDEEDYASFVIEKTNDLEEGLINVLDEIKKDFKDVKPDDIGVIYIDNEDYIYNMTVRLKIMIKGRFDWDANVAYDTKEKIPNAIFISNRNNVKGLEFPIVVCLTKQISKDIPYRNTLYTMISRSFIRTYFVILNSKENGLSNVIENGINNTLQNKRIDTIAPTDKDIEEMRKVLMQAKKAESLNDKFERICKELCLSQEEIKKVKAFVNIEKIRKINDDALRLIIQSAKSAI